MWSRSLVIAGDEERLSDSAAGFDGGGGVGGPLEWKRLADDGPYPPGLEVAQRLGDQLGLIAGEPGLAAEADDADAARHQLCGAGLERFAGGVPVDHDPADAVGDLGESGRGDRAAEPVE